MDQRVRWLDTAKGIGIFFVIAGHSLTGPIREASPVYDLLYELIYAFHMPLLVFLSGCSFSLAQKRYAAVSPCLFAEKKAKSFLLPYLSYNLVVYLFFAAANCFPALTHILEDAGYGFLSPVTWIRGFLHGSSPYAYHTWYMYAMFLYSILTYTAIRLFPDCLRRQQFCCGLFAFILLLIHFFTPVGTWPGMRDITYFYLWFILGWQFCGRQLSVSASLFCIFTPLAVFLINTIFPIASGMPFIHHTGKLLLRVLTVPGIVSLIPRLKGLTETLFHFLGLHSMEIYLFHQPFIGSCLGGLLFMIFDIPPFITVAAAIVFSILFPLAAGSVIKRFGRLKLLFSL